MKNIIIISLLIFFSCNSSRTQQNIIIDTAAVNLNNEAIQLSLKASSNRKANYKKAIALLDSAIKISPDYHTAYSNKANFLNLIGEEAEALKCIDSLLRIVPDMPEAIFQRGLQAEKVYHSRDSANKYYYKAHTLFKNRYEDKPSFKNLQSYVFAVKYHFDDKTALKILRNEKGNFKDSVSIAPTYRESEVKWKSFEQMIKSPREIFLKSGKSF